MPALLATAPAINTVVLERMLRVLMEDVDYPTSWTTRAAGCPGSLDRTQRPSRPHPARSSGRRHLGALPWLGSYAFLALERFLKIKCADQLQLKGLDCRVPISWSFA